MPSLDMIAGAADAFTLYGALDGHSGSVTAGELTWL